MLCLHGFKKVVLVTSAKLLIIIPLGYVHTIRYKMNSNGTELEQVVHSHTAADPGKGPGEPAPPYFVEPAEARRAEKNFFETGPPLPYLRVRVTALCPPYLKVWIRHWVGREGDPNPTLHD